MYSLFDLSRIVSFTANMYQLIITRLKSGSHDACLAAELFGVAVMAAVTVVVRENDVTASFLA